MIDFPTPIFIGQAYTFGDRTWTWNGSGWERNVNNGQSTSTFVMAAIRVDSGLILPMPVTADFNLLNYI